jgi:dipeptidyl aminopeptidase/acylaminoacyl peptidase
MSISRLLRKLAGAAALTATSLVAVGAFTAIATTGAHAQAVKQYPLRDFFKNPERAYFRLSADGKHIGFMQPYENRRNIFVQPFDKVGTNEGIKRITSETVRDIPTYYFKGSDHVLFVNDVDGSGNPHVISVNIHSGEKKDLTPHEGARASIVDALPGDDDHILVAHNKRDKSVSDVYRVNLQTGRETLIARNPGNVTDWVADHNGKLRAANATDGVNNVLLYREKETDDFKPIVTTNFREKVEIVGWTADNKQMYVSTNRGRDKSALFEFDPRTAKEGKLIHENPLVDVWNLAWSRARKVITYSNVNVDRYRPVFFDKEWERIYNAISAQLPGSQLNFQGTTKDEQRMIVAASNDRTPGARYVYDVKTNKLSKLGEINSAIAEADMAEMKPIQYTSRDGLAIRGFLTVPRGVVAKNLPVIVRPRSFLGMREGWGFNAENQFLANRGYAVLQVNFRGTTGLGRKFQELGAKQWGLAMQDDITDGVQWLIKEGVADPKRIAIYGESFGGYAALSGITKTPDLYAAAVSNSGMSNLFSYLNTAPAHEKALSAIVKETIGDPDRDKAQLTATSPALNVEKIKTPLFIAQGAKDPRVLKTDSDQMVEALRKRGLEVEYMVKENEGHGFRNQENQFEFYEAMEKFLAKHLKASL